eukprot:12906018-Prorocentrum_lima.AAC.1
MVVSCDITWHWRYSIVASASFEPLVQGVQFLRSHPVLVVLRVGRMLYSIVAAERATYYGWQKQVIDEHSSASVVVT